MRERGEIERGEIEMKRDRDSDRERVYERCTCLDDSPNGFV